MICSFLRWRSSILPGPCLSQRTSCEGGEVEVKIKSYDYPIIASRVSFVLQCLRWNSDNHPIIGSRFSFVLAQSVPCWVKSSSHIAWRRSQGFLIKNLHHFAWCAFYIWQDGMVLKLVLEKLTGQEVCILQKAIHYQFFSGSCFRAYICA